jgi:hypothetical protein
MAFAWAMFWVASIIWFEDAPETYEPKPIQLVPVTPSSENEASAGTESNSATVTIVTGREMSDRIVSLEEIAQAPPKYRMSRPQLGVSVAMCWHAMTCFFVLGAWEANIPVFASTATQFGWSPFAAGKSPSSISSRRQFY